MQVKETNQLEHFGDEAGGAHLIDVLNGRLLDHGDRQGEVSPGALVAVTARSHLWRSLGRESGLRRGVAAALAKGALGLGSRQLIGELGRGGDAALLLLLLTGGDRVEESRLLGCEPRATVHLLAVSWRRDRLGEWGGW